MRSAKSARQILLNQYDELGMHSGKIVNLLELGINTIDDEIVVHPWAQSILDEQWCAQPLTPTPTPSLTVTLTLTLPLPLPLSLTR